MGAAEYKQYIFPMLFWKRLCDVWVEENNNSIQQYGKDFDENHRIIIPESAHWSEVRKKPFDVGQAINNALRNIESNNSNQLAGVFGDSQWTDKQKLPDGTLRDLMEHFSTLDLSLENLPEDELGNGYEFLIRKFADDSGHTAAEFYTNRTVVHLMVNLLKPKAGESIYDPTCGSGGMLVSSLFYLKKQNEEFRNVGLYGQEINILTSAIAKMNMFIHGVQDFTIHLGDTLSEPKFIENSQLKKFDVILANPPYSIKNWNRGKWVSDKWGRNRYGTPPQGNADFAFFQHILHSMKQRKGRSAILLPNGILFREAEYEIRKKIIQDDKINCIIGLGPDLFYNSTMESCIVICNNRKSARENKNILFIDARKMIKRISAHISELTEEHIETIADTYHDWEEKNGFSRVISLDEITSNDYSLKLDLYLGEDHYKGEYSDKEFEDLTRGFDKSIREFDGRVRFIRELVEKEK